MTAIIHCAGLTKTYQNGVTALEDLTLTIEEGMSFGLMGENGAGKSTLVRLLMGFIFPTKGSLTILGESDARPSSACPTSSSLSSAFRACHFYPWASATIPVRTAPSMPARCPAS